MAAFEKNSKIGLKGTEITFTGVLNERKKSRLIFKSSGNDKVICELASPIDDRNAELSVGSTLTVVGKVRGRGILRNVTLDECGLASSDVGTRSSDLISQKPTATETSPEQSEEAAEKPLETRDQEARIPGTGSSSGPVSTTRFSPRRPVQAPAPHPSELPGERPCSQGHEQPDTIIGVASSLAKAHLLDAFYALLAVLGGLELLAYVKLRRAFIAARLGTSLTRPSPAEVRRDALEALLLEKKKKKWWTSTP